jgi:hypothetical protein
VKIYWNPRESFNERAVVQRQPRRLAPEETLDYVLRDVTLLGIGDGAKCREKGIPVVEPRHDGQNRLRRPSPREKQRVELRAVHEEGTPFERLEPDTNDSRTRALDGVEENRRVGISVKAGEREQGGATETRRRCCGERGDQRCVLLAPAFRQALDDWQQAPALRRGKGGRVLLCQVYGRVTPKFELRDFSHAARRVDERVARVFKRVRR